MNARGLRRYVDDLLCGRRPRPFDADRFEAAQIRTAIELRAARMGSGAPSEHFLTDLQRRLAARVPGAREPRTRSTDRTQHVVRWLSPRRPPRLRGVPALSPEPLQGTSSPTATRAPTGPRCNPVTAAGRSSRRAQMCPPA
jgi:hypothetical protein